MMAETSRLAGAKSAPSPAVRSAPGQSSFSSGSRVWCGHFDDGSGLVVLKGPAKASGGWRGWVMLFNSLEQALDQPKSIKDPVTCLYHWQLDPGMTDQIVSADVGRLLAGFACQNHFLGSAALETAGKPLVVRIEMYRLKKSPATLATQLDSVHMLDHRNFPSTLWHGSCWRMKNEYSRQIGLKAMEYRLTLYSRSHSSYFVLAAGYSRRAVSFEIRIGFHRKLGQGKGRREGSEICCCG